MVNLCLFSVVACLFALFNRVNGAIVPVEVNDAIKKAQPGQIVDISALHFDQSKDILNSHDTGRSFETIPGYLLYSDDPETAKDYGILYADTVPSGITRVYIYHVNGLSPKAKITAVLTNPSASQSANISFVRKALVPPSSDYLAVGAEGVRQYYENLILPPNVILAPSSSVVMDAELDSITVSFDELIGAIYDIHADLPLTYSILMLASGTDTLVGFEEADYPAKDGSHRLGTFIENKKMISDTTPLRYAVSDGAKYFEISSNPKYTNNDMPLIGVSSFDNSTSTLSGNYGVEYVLDFVVDNDQGSDDVSLAVMINPRGGAYTGYIRISALTVISKYVTDDFDNGSTVGQSIPIVESTKDGALCSLISIPQSNSSTTSVRIEFMPAGSTSLPVWLLLVPAV